MSDFSGGNVTTVRTEAMKEAIKQISDGGGDNVVKAEDVNKKLIEAAKVGNLSSALKCIEDGASASFREKIHGLTALHHSAKNGHSDFVTAFLVLTLKVEQNGKILQLSCWLQLWDI